MLKKIKINNKKQVKLVKQVKQMKMMKTAKEIQIQKQKTKMVMLMNIMIMELGMKDKLKMAKDMEKENSIIKLVEYMMDNGKMEKLMDQELFIMPVVILLTMDNGKTKCLMVEE